MSGLLAGIRAVVFDAVGTLIVPDPPPAEIYGRVGRKHGVLLADTEIARRFRDAFHKEEETDRAAGWAVDEEHEKHRWHLIVSAVFGDAFDESIFRELYEHFAQPASWHVADEASEVLKSLAGRGCLLGVASNFDHRLHAILDGRPELSPLRFCVVSSEVGWRKPDPRFFAAVVLAVGCEPGEILFVGDSRENDYDGANSAGLRGVLMHDQPNSNPALRAIQNLQALL